MTFNNQVKYGEEAWDNVRKMANIDTPTFSIHQVVKILLIINRSWPCPDDKKSQSMMIDEEPQVYPEQLLGKIAKKAFQTLGCSADEFFEVKVKHPTPHPLLREWDTTLSNSVQSMATAMYWRSSAGLGNLA